MILAMIILALNGAPDIDKVVLAIEAVEHSAWTLPGGGLQWKESTWREETRESFTLANSREFSRQLAAQRLTKFVRKLHALDIPATPELLGSIWNRGWTGALMMRRHKEVCDYGQRVRNYHDFYLCSPKNR
jgi:hypothetical protein